MSLNIKNQEIFNQRIKILGEILFNCKKKNKKDEVIFKYKKNDTGISLIIRKDRGDSEIIDLVSIDFKIFFKNDLIAYPGSVGFHSKYFKSIPFLKKIKSIVNIKIDSYPKKLEEQFPELTIEELLELNFILKLEKKFEKYKSAFVFDHDHLLEYYHSKQSS